MRIKGYISIDNAVCECTFVRITLTMHNADQIQGMFFKVEFSNLASRNLSRNKKLKKIHQHKFTVCFATGAKFGFPRTGYKVIVDCGVLSKMC